MVEIKRHVHVKSWGRMEKNAGLTYAKGVEEQNKCGSVLVWDNWVWQNV